MVVRLILPLVVLSSMLTFAAAAPAGAQAAESPSAGHEPAAGEGAESLNPLKSWKLDSAVHTAIVFLVLLLVLWKFAWKPLAEGLDRRERRVADDIAAAQRANLEAQNLLAQYHEKLATSEGEVREILERARRDAEHLGRELLEKARAETDVEKRRALREIETATAAALKELADRSASLAVELAGKIVHSRLDPKAHARLIEEAVSRFASVKPNGGS
jgi:F-type H+-transporting ATPase subunit b